MNTLKIQLFNNYCIIETNIEYFINKLNKDVKYKPKNCKFDKNKNFYKIPKDIFEKYAKLTINDISKIGSFDINIYNGPIISSNKEKSIPKKTKMTKKIDSKLFDNMIYKPYGKGYLLFPNGSKDYGYIGNKETNYYHGGWWRDDLNCWFFRGSLLNVLVDNGAKLINETKPLSNISNKGISNSNDKQNKNLSEEEYSETESENESEEEYSETESEEEYSVTENESDNETEPEEYSESEEEYSVTESESESEDYQIIMKGVYYRKYKKGLLVTGNIKTYKQELTDLEGLYNSRLNGFIFRNKSLDILIEHGVKKDK